MILARMLGGVAAGCVAWTALAAPEIDTSAARAKTDLEPGLTAIGSLKPRPAKEIEASNWTVGCETVDRDYTDYHAYKAYLGPLGIKKLRFQAGWAKCEKTRGVYDFAWIDAVAADAAAQGLELWLEVSYGNPLYPGGGTTGLGGGIPTSEEALAAWDKWVEACARRYAGKVREWEIWNEPNGNRRHTPVLVADFNVRTARVIKKADPAAKIAGLALAGTDAKYFDGFVKRIAEQEALGLFTWFSFHGYPRNPDDLYGSVGQMKRALEKYPCAVRLRQGESGCPSELQNGLALRGYPWSELMQAKWDLRRMMGDLGRDLESSVFAAMDMIYAGSDARVINRKGLLRTAPDKTVEKVKLAYYAVQNTVSVFDSTLTRVTNEVAAVACAKRTSCYVYRNEATGQHLLAVWDRSGTPSDTNATVSAQITLTGCALKEPVWVDLVSGRIFEFPAARVSREGDTVVFREVPVYDAPVLLAEKALVVR
jgi:hypothetical protein